MIKKEIEGKQLKQVLHFRFSFEPRFSEVDKSLFLAPPLRTTSCNVHYTGSILFDNERETWSKSSIPKVVGSIPTVARHIFQACPVWISGCGYTLRVTSQASYSPEYITPTQKISS